MWGKRLALPSDRPIASARREFIDSSWGARHPGANIGIEVGATAGLVVLDINANKGGWETLTLASFVEATEEWGALEVLSPWVKGSPRKGVSLLTVNPPACLSARTGTGNLHCYFALPAGWPSGYAGGELGPGLALYCDGDYVVAPPSVHRSWWKKQEGAWSLRYTWHPERNLLAQAPPPAPEWLLAQLSLLNPRGAEAPR